MSFPPKVAEQALLDCGRHCCICHKFCGTKIQLHHIEQRADDGEDSYENCIPLCLDCHAEVNSYNDKHPIGRKFTASELKGHRDRWYEKVKKNYGVTTNPDYIELDRKLFLQIKELLSSNGSMQFICEHDYGGTFDTELHNALYEFIDLCKQPEFEFLDADTEGLKGRLADCINQFLRAIGEHTFPLKGWTTRNRIPRDPMQDFEILAWFREKAKDENEFNELVKQQREYIRKIHRELNDLAQQVCNAYNEFIRFGRRKLAV